MSRAQRLDILESFRLRHNKVSILDFLPEQRFILFSHCHCETLTLANDKHAVVYSKGNNMNRVVNRHLLKGIFLR